MKIKMRTIFLLNATAQNTSVFVSSLVLILVVLVVPLFLVACSFLFSLLVFILTTLAFLLMLLVIQF